MSPSDELARALEAADPAVSIVHVPAGLWRAALDEPALPLRAGLLRADLAEDRPLAALAVIELRERRLPVRVASRPLGLVASRRALAGLEVGGGSARRVSRLARGLLAAGHVGPPRSEGRRFRWRSARRSSSSSRPPCWPRSAARRPARRGSQRAADLAALSGARSLRDDFPRLFAPARLAERGPQPAPSRQGRVSRPAAAIAARRPRRRNGVDPDDLRVSLSRSRARSRRCASGPRSRPRSIAERAARSASAVAAAARRPPRSGSRRAPRRRPPRRRRPAAPTMASGGGYSGPLAYRQGKPMRPDVAAAFDRMAAAARARRDRAGRSTRPTDPTPSRRGSSPSTPIRAGSRRRASRSTAARPSSTSGRRPPTAGWPPTRRASGS